MNMTDAEHFSGAATFGPVAVRLSRTETETLCFKAARGAGHSWGIAEEAATAVGWLCAQGLDGTSALLAAIVAPTFVGPAAADGQWTAQEGRGLCPLLTGTTLADFAGTDAGPFTAETVIGPVHQPVLLLPFLSQCAEVLNAAVQVTWGHRTLVVGRTIMAEPADIIALANAAVATITVTIAQQEEIAAAPVPFASALPHTLAALNALALRTTVPATEESRNSGAGAGTSDND